MYKNVLNSKLQNLDNLKDNAGSQVTRLKQLDRIATLSIRLLTTVAACSIETTKHVTTQPKPHNTAFHSSRYR